jgi:hypothetical protein
MTTTVSDYFYLHMDKYENLTMAWHLNLLLDYVQRIDMIDILMLLVIFQFKYLKCVIFIFQKTELCQMISDIM